MKKFKILGVLLAVLAFSAVAVAGASASLWLVSGKTPTKNVTLLSHGEIILVHEGGTLGKAKIKCTGLFNGTIVEKESSTTLAENLTGTEKDLIGGCTTIEGFCAGAIIHPTGLPWHGLLIEEASGTWNEFLTSGYNVLCSFGIQVECKGKVKSKFEGNGTNGAKFSFKGKESDEQECSDGGKGTVESPSAGEVLGATVS